MKRYQVDVDGVASEVNLVGLSPDVLDQIQDVCAAYKTKANVYRTDGDTRTLVATVRPHGWNTHGCDATGADDGE